MNCNAPKADCVMPAVLMKLNDAIVKQKIRIIIFFSSILFYFPSRWHCIVLCWVLHLSSIELQQPQRRSLFNIRRQHQATINDAAQGRNYGNGLEAFIRDGRCALVIPPGPHGYERVLHNCLNDFKSIVWEILFLFFMFLTQSGELHHVWIGGQGISHSPSTYQRSVPERPFNDRPWCRYSGPRNRRDEPNIGQRVSHVYTLKRISLSPLHSVSNF